MLLLIRGMVNGLKPETTKTVASTTATSALLHVVVQHGGVPAANANVEVRRLPNGSPPLKTGTTAANGEVEFKDLAAGTVWVVATLDPGGGAAPSTATQKVELTAGATQSISLAL